MKIKRNIVRIDEEKCNGCGLCVPSCHEGAIQLINGKARVVKESYCDGLGACLGECPQNAITIETREAEAFDPEAVEKAKQQQQEVKPHHHHGGCPGSKAFAFASKTTNDAVPPTQGAVASELRQWPVQLHLVPIEAPYWEDADLLIAADCVSVAYGDFQRKLLQNKRVIIACPKLDRTENYVDKLANILMINNIRSVTVGFMEVPCCSGLVHIVKEALTKCGKPIPLHLVRIGLQGSREDIVS